MPRSKSRTSCDDIRCYLAELTVDMTMDYHRVDRFVCQDDCIVMVGVTCWHHDKTGKPAESPKVDVWRIKDGKAVSFHEYYDTATVIGAGAP